MSIISLEQQRQLGRYLGRLRQNSPELSESGEPARISGLGFASFIMLGGFALLKDIFDFVFVAMAFFKSKLVAGADAASMAADAAALALWLVPEPTGGTKLAALIANITSWVATGASWIGSFLEAKTQAEGIILPFLFTTMFMIVVVAVLLLSGMGIESYKIFLSTRFIFTSIVATIVEIVPVLNIFPWITIFVIFLYFYVKRELKKQQGQEQTA